MKKPLPNRQSIRLKNYDYSTPGFYFITICTQNRENRFGKIIVKQAEIDSSRMELNNAGKMILSIWNKIPQYYNRIQIDEFIIMPNHIHGIIQIVPIVGADSISARDSAKRTEIDSAPTDSILSESAMRTEMDSKRTEMDSVPTDSKRTDSINRTEIDSKRVEIDSAPTVGTVVQMFKRYTTIEYIKMVKQNMAPRFDRRMWERNYWEHIIRNENELNRIRNYIRNNPQKWGIDKLKKGLGNKVKEAPPEYGEEIWMV